MNDLFATVEDWSEGRITRRRVGYNSPAAHLFVGSFGLFRSDITDMFAGAV